MIATAPELTSAGPIVDQDLSATPASPGFRTYVDPTSVPEPSTLALLSGGAVIVAIRMLRVRSRADAPVNAIGTNLAYRGPAPQ
jgi:hypothetical protein